LSNIGSCPLGALEGKQFQILSNPDLWLIDNAVLCLKAESW
jgi:hypothetical protein